MKTPVSNIPTKDRLNWIKANSKIVMELLLSLPPPTAATPPKGLQGLSTSYTMDYITFSECSSVCIFSIIYAMSCLVHGLHLHGLPWWNHDVTKKWSNI